MCSDFFQRYDTMYEEMRIRADLVDSKYENWSKTLIEPTALNVAKMYALEVRVQEEEKIRL